MKDNEAPNNQDISKILNEKQWKNYNVETDHFYQSQSQWRCEASGDEKPTKVYFIYIYAVNARTFPRNNFTG